MKMQCPTHRKTSHQIDLSILYQTHLLMSRTLLLRPRTRRRPIRLVWCLLRLILAAIYKFWNINYCRVQSTKMKIFQKMNFFQKFFFEKWKCFKNKNFSKNEFFFKNFFRKMKIIQNLKFFKKWNFFKHEMFSKMRLFQKLSYRNRARARFFSTRARACACAA